MKALSQAAVIAALSLTAAGATWWAKGPPERKVHCDPATLKPHELCIESVPRDAEVLWVDARSRKDWMRSGVPGSVLWNLDPAEDMQAFEAEVAPRVLQAPRVIVYCYDESCGISHQVADRIRALDLGADVAVLRGGWRALKDAGWIKDSSREP